MVIIYCVRLSQSPENHPVSWKMVESTADVFLDVRKIDIVDKEKDAWMKFVFKWTRNAGSQNGKPRGNAQ